LVPITSPAVARPRTQPVAILPKQPQPSMEEQVRMSTVITPPLLPSADERYVSTAMNTNSLPPPPWYQETYPPFETAFTPLISLHSRSHGDLSDPNDGTRTEYVATRRSSDNDNQIDTKPCYAMEHLQNDDDYQSANLGALLCHDEILSLSDSNHSSSSSGFSVEDAKLLCETLGV
jgi:hypothetical protein